MGILSDWLKKASGIQRASQEKHESDEPLKLNANVTNTVARIIQSEADLKSISTKSIVCNGQKMPINWHKVVLWSDLNGFRYENNCYKTQFHRSPQMLVAHWDGCLSTNSMVKVTKERGLSVHFGIDNDGTIFQMLDTKDIAWHAKGVNNVSIGVEISNGFMLKYNDYYKKMGFGPRDIVQTDIVHMNNIGPHLDFYPIQKQALKALIEAVHAAHNIPLEVPKKDGIYLKGVSKEVVDCTFKGVVGHFHITTNKIDPGSLPIDEIVEEIKNES